MKCKYTVVNSRQKLGNLYSPFSLKTKPIDLAVI